LKSLWEREKIYNINWFQTQFLAQPLSKPKNFTDGVDIIERTLSRANNEAEPLACTLSSAQPNQNSPSMNVERLADGRVILQFYAAETDSPVGSEGWFNFVENETIYISVENDVRTVWDGSSDSGFIQIHFAGGVMFSQKLFVSI
jgi:hypothetical protein